jgi:hypothetical protein
MKLRALTGMAGATVIQAGEVFEASTEEGNRLIEAGYAEAVTTKPSDAKETTSSKPAANRETRGGTND